MAWNNGESFPITIQRTVFDALSANFTKWSNTLKRFVGNLPANCLSVFDHYVGPALKGEMYCFGQITLSI